MALKSAEHSHAQRRKAKKKLEKHEVDYEAWLRSLPESERKETPSTRQRTKDSRELVGDGEGTGSVCSRQPASNSFGWNEAREVTNNFRTEFLYNLTIAGLTHCEQVVTINERKYCSQACLSGLMRGHTVDPKCPNIDLHQSCNERHALDSQNVASLLHEQLYHNPDRGCKPLWKQGARGALFKITLLSHGYCFVAKGTVKAFESDLKHEAKMYQILEHLQGTAIPVCLGISKLGHRFYLAFGVKITTMLFLAWGGEEISNETITNPDVRKTVFEAKAAGIDQRDLRCSNLLWNEETRRVMMIDFERAIKLPEKQASTYHKIPRKVLEEWSPNKRHKYSLTKDMAFPSSKQAIWT